MKELVYLAADEEMTAQLANRLAKVAEAGDVLALTGDLGAGKTTLTRHLARALGVPPDAPVTSPTFTLQNFFTGHELNIFHLDLYRLSGDNELSGLGAEEWLESGALVIVEWADRAREAVGDDYLEIRIEAVEGDARRFTFLPRGPAAADLVRALEIVMQEEPC